MRCRPVGLSTCLHVEAYVRGIGMRKVLYGVSTCRRADPSACHFCVASIIVFSFLKIKEFH